MHNKDYLAHHKYIKKVRKNGKWVYYYANTTASNTSSTKKVDTSKIPAGASKEYLEEVAFNSQKNTYELKTSNAGSSTTSGGGAYMFTFDGNGNTVYQGRQESGKSYVESKMAKFKNTSYSALCKAKDAIAAGAKAVANFFKRLFR